MTCVLSFSHIPKAFKGCSSICSVEVLVAKAGEHKHFGFHIIGVLNSMVAVPMIFNVDATESTGYVMYFFR